MTSVIADARASLSLSPVATLPSNVQHFTRHAVETAKHASVRVQQVSSGGAKGQHRWENVCAGEGSEVLMKLAARAARGPKQLPFLDRNHYYPAEKTRSALDAWAIAGGKASNT